MTRRTTDRALSALAWLGFLAVMAATLLFLADLVLPRTVASPARTSAPVAVATDLALVLLFGLQHSTMARPGVKAWLRRWVPARLERSAYVAASVACLGLLVAAWQPFDGDVWSLGGPAAYLLWGLYAAGWLLALASMYAVDYYELTGLRQAGWLRPRPASEEGLQVGGLYAVVRHPLMTGLLMVFWATPTMGAAHLLLAVAMTAYVAVGVHYEERDLRRTFGPAYDDYAARVPAVIPLAAGLRRRRRGPRPDGVRPAPHSPRVAAAAPPSRRTR